MSPILPLSFPSAVNSDKPNSLSEQLDAPTAPRRSLLARLRHALGFKTVPAASSRSLLEAKVTAHLAAYAVLEPKAALVKAGSRIAGLCDDEVVKLRAQYGLNELTSARGVGMLALLGNCFANPFNFLLLVLAIISIATGDKATFTVMMLMVLISTVMRFWQERKSVLKAAQLASRLTSHVQAFRNAGSVLALSPTTAPPTPVTLSRSDLVPGDVLHLTSGDLLAADCVVLSAHSLTVSQSMLTGEVMPVEKWVYAASNEETEEEEEEEVIHRPNVLLAGSSVAAGEGVALVVSTGDHTYIASIATVLQGRRPLNAFEISIRRISYLLLGFMAVMTPIVFVIQGLVNKAAGWKGAFLFSISVAVGLTPEMLPLVVNANLAQGAIAMGKKNVIVKRLDGVQNLGGITCFCTDKTGTLTIDRVELHSSLTPFNTPSALPLSLAFINSSLQTGTRSLLDGAITSAPGAGEGITITEVVKLDEVPFDSARRLLSVYVTENAQADDALIITKGAVDEVLERCIVYTTVDSAEPLALTTAFAPRPSLPLDAAALARIRETADELNGHGLRLVAVAQRAVKNFRSHGITISKFSERDLVFVGFLAFLDPPKPDAKEAVQDLQDLGITVKILTGDAPAIAVKVARDIGLLPLATPGVVPSAPTGDVITGAQLAVLSLGPRADMTTAVQRAVIFAKLSPYQKLEVVEVLREGGATVGMMGDGVNDALALRGADVGISVDTGMEIAKSASEIILLEKSLATVVHGVRLGRKTLLNTIKYLKMAASSNFGNVFSILAASAWLPYQPMMPLQILVQNLLYDFSQGTIPFDNVDDDYLTRPVRWSLASVARFMIIFGPVSSIFDITTFSLNWWYFGINSHADDAKISLAQTQWFMLGSCTQTLVVYFLRTGKIPFIQSSPSKTFLASTLFFLFVAQVLPYIPGLNNAFTFVHPEPVFYGFMAAMVLAYCTLVQIVKVGYQRIWHEWL